MLRKVEAAQKAGFTYLTIGQHYLYDGFRWFQPVPMLARLAAELDDHVRIGTTVLVGPLHHPVQLAEDLATLDVVTRGKLVVGIGTGYLPHEYEVFGKPFKQRYSLLEELIEVMTKLWTQVRRAARHGDVWTITPQQTIEQVEELVGAYLDERAKFDLPLTKFPLRRELHLGADPEDALHKFAEVARVKYVSYADQGMQLLDKERVEREFLDNVKDHVLLGNGEQVRDQIRDIAARLPVGPLLVRPHWPGMDADQTVAYLEQVGREVVEPLEDLQSIGFEELKAKQPA
jgi:alkanesulfonate monooxygenase SsuD/methylene tetrahydromethanopterin reductase-like flavin-dependent oxidoreductase (luciferase family)